LFSFNGHDFFNIVKYTLILLFSFISLCFTTPNVPQLPQLEPLRTALTKFLQQVRDPNFILSQDCFSGGFDVDVEKLREAVSKYDLMGSFVFLKNLKDYIEKSCPLNEITLIKSEVDEAIASGKINSNMFANIFSLIGLLNQVPKSNDYEGLGTFFGKLYNIIILNKQPKLRFLAGEPDFTDLPLLASPGLDFVQGFLEAVSDVEFGQNQCFKLSHDFLPEISDALTQLYNALVTRTNISQAIQNFLAVAIKFKDFENYCHFVSLATTLSTITSYYSLAKLGWNIVKNILTISSVVKQLFVDARAQNIKGVGNGTGKLFSILLDYHTQ